jgi:hypothetical protein
MAEVLTNADYQSAVYALDACNLSGIVHSWSEIMTKLWAEARKEGKGTDWVNTHPICRLYAEKVRDLSGLNYDTFSEAYHYCANRME